MLFVGTKSLPGKEWPLVNTILRLMYYLGEGTRKNPVNSYAWMLLAADQHYFPAMQDISIVESDLALSEITKANRLKKKLEVKYKITSSDKSDL